LMRLSARAARRTAVIEITTFWFGMDTFKVRAKAPGSAWGGCRISDGLPLQQLRPG
jgi:hypothetical protein